MTKNNIVTCQVTPPNMLSLQLDKMQVLGGKSSGKVK